MTSAIHASTRSSFLAGNCFETCGEKLSELVSKVRELFMAILRLIFPCFLIRELQQQNQELRQHCERLTGRNRELNERNIELGDQQRQRRMENFHGEMGHFLAEVNAQIEEDALYRQQHPDQPRSPVERLLLHRLNEAEAEIERLRAELNANQDG